MTAPVLHTMKVQRTRTQRDVIMLSEIGLWLTMLVLVIGVQIMLFPANVDFALEIFATEGRGSDALATGLEQLGISQRTYGVIGVAWSLVLGVIVAAISLVILLKHRREEWFAVAVAFVLLAGTGAHFPPLIAESLAGQPFWIWTARFATLIGIVGFFLMPFLFPNGRFVPRWMAVVGLVVALSGGAFILAPDWDPPALLATDRSPVDEIVIVALAIGSLLYRYRRKASIIERQQMKWAAVGLGLAVPTFFLGDFLLYRIDGTPAGVLAYLGFSFFMGFSGLVFPLSIAFAVLRYRLFDIDVLINRLLVYGVLTGLVIGTYVVIVLGVGSLIHSERNLLLSVIATGIIAVGFQAVRERVQRAIDRAFFGDRGNPYAITMAVAAELERVVRPAEILPVVVESLARSLRLPFAGVELLQQGAPVMAAQAGVDPGVTERFPLTFQGVELGALIVAPRAASEPLSQRDQQLLTDLARQIGVAAHGVLTDYDLQAARQRLVTTREEERRRLRRDLHDGLGAQLAALSMQAGTIKAVAKDDPDTVEMMAEELQGELRLAIAEIRRLVHGLRPPALDELGLVSALRERARSLSVGGLNRVVRIDVEAPAEMPPIPAAVEVAIYRIVEEALTNVLRHAEADRCLVTITVGPEIEVTIADDGIGANDTSWGVGSASMRERAEELGGALVTRSGLDGKGLSVRATIPLPRPGEPNHGG